jgi:hypothetical protein
LSNHSLTTHYQTYIRAYETLKMATALFAGRLENFQYPVCHIPNKKFWEELIAYFS